ncbi:adenylate/guanylate cyclase domain-containing protein [Legionella anisa]|uniref:Adenylate/guanylate cyclase domain-containing protein n=1 Tax=Legionella anisa TaxID=28082 RepID=A0AAX0WSH1_9GAMM|nr:adenylate/guanylate cyclase domain-containing protein [Legionella anisa]AWN75185.1 adenylate/guanylate cyclase domain-containing protein [Legionella anisa]KTC66979.1 guanylate cyclase [Legionella anisa]MBN5936592.1 adenylate/guanylate cyclase domain-containing protein [Legionella anisa]MCW8424593.1 adenylate/guanylate cyclase domain-containing protein [Legionella anisa]MCW8446288.1 adenylate/guanylate cyclase domain-containing protein [Legionella anisa]
MTQTPLEEEILKTEKLRTTILSIVFALLSLMWIIFIIYAPEIFFRIGNISALLLPAYLASATLYFLLMRVIISQYIAHKKNIPTYLRYLNAFLEINIPTFGIIIATNFQTPVYVLLMPPVLLYFIFIILSSLTLNEWICRFSGLVAAIEYWGLSYYILNYTNITSIDYYLVAWFAFAARGMILLIAGIITGFVTSQIKKQLFAAFDAQKERDRIEGIFGRHVSPEVVSKLLSKDAHASEYLPVCIMFLDIRNFSYFTEQNEPSVVVDYLNNLFKHIVKIIHDNKGIINKFLGDGFMAVFGAPLSNGNDVANAANAALTIIQCIEEERKKGTLPDLKLGIGLHFGHAVTGTIGTKKRQEYTIIGDVVNSAAHIEQLNKTYHSQVLISEDAMKQLSEIKGEFVGNATLKHRDTPIKLYKLA